MHVKDKYTCQEKRVRGKRMIRKNQETANHESGKRHEKEDKINV